uniref:uncharacterized protein LOC120329969 n=1 Tax=Styela clava TaxID=7725 RepID=UPI00193A8121|nr:uncharacterized protein LOC120329969 [Styela clava]
MNFSTNNSGLRLENLLLNGDSLAIWLWSISLGYVAATTYIMIMLIIDIFVNGVGINRNESIGKKFKAWIKLSRLIFAILCNLTFLTGSVLHIIVDLYYPEYCQIYMIVKIILSGCLLFTCYFTVWLRHRIIYSIPAIKHLTNSITRIVSILVIVLVAATRIGNVLVILLNFEYKDTETGCQMVESKIPIQVPFLIFNASSVVTQVMILGLFIYPLRRHQRGIGGDADNLTPVLKRAFYTTLVCCLSDTAAAFVVIVAGNFATNASMHTTFFINLLMILVSFPEWKTTIFPCNSLSSEEN